MHPLHPVLAVMAADPGRLWTTAELRPHCTRGDAATYLQHACRDGLVERVVPEVSGLSALAWRFVRLPARLTRHQALVRPPADSPYGRTLAAAYANPEAWFGQSELSELYPDCRTFDLTALERAALCLRVRDALRAGPQGERELVRALGSTPVRVRQALGSLRYDGEVTDVGEDPVRYVLVEPDLPRVPAALTASARRLQGLLVTPNSELGLMGLTGWPRDEVRAGLARLQACGLLEWRGVGHLIVYRARAVLDLTAQAAD